MILTLIEYHNINENKNIVKARYILLQIKVGHKKR